MTDGLLTVLKWTGLSIAGGLIGVMGYRQLFTLGRPGWAGLWICLAAAGVAGGVIAFQRFRHRRSDPRAVEQQEVARQAKADARKSFEGIEILRSQWKTAIQFLRRSGLRKQGNPLYVLPWYMVLGPAGSGKTTALHSARLPSFAESNGAEPVSPTPHCEWSFFDQAIVLDTAGRYAVPVDPIQDTQEWTALLDLLYRTRPREPLNGLTVVVPADQLLTESLEALESAGKTIRKRMDHLMHALGTKCPVYVLVTKCDLIPGMASLCGGLSPEGLNQAMGYLNEAASSDTPVFVDRAFAMLGERIKNMRLLLAAQPGAEGLNPALLVLPDTFNEIRVKLGSFLQGAFQENFYQETPWLRGLYLAGGKPGSFLNEFFSKVLPADRWLSVPTQRARIWRRGTWSLGMASYLALAALFCGLLSFAFLKNIKTLSVLREADQEFSNPLGPQGDAADSIVNMDRLRETLLRVEKENSGWIRNLGLRDVAGVETALKAKLSAHFRREILGPFDLQTRTAITALNAASSDVRFSQFVSHLVSRLGLLRQHSKGADLNAVLDTTLPLPFLRAGNREADPDTRERFAKLYAASIFWSAQSADLNQELDTLQTQLKHLLKLKGRDPQWLVAWAAAQNTAPSVTLSGNWGGEPLSTREPAIPGLFSIKGKALIDSFFMEIDEALKDPVVSQDLKTHFEHWYRQSALQAWHQFVTAFPSGRETLPTSDAWQRAAALMPDEKGAYFALLNQTEREFESVAAAELPVWMRHLHQLRDLQRTPAFWKYRQALEKTAKAMADRAQVLQITTQAFDGQAAPSASVFGAAYEALAQLKASAPKDLSEDAEIWRLMSGPLDFLWDYARRTTADHLQKTWQSKVLAEATGLDGAQALPVLLTREGPVLRFAKEQASPFVQWKPGRGFCAKEAYQGSVPFAPAFFTFLNGAVWTAGVNSLQVEITALTPETNAGARRIPHVTRLTLDCGEKKPQTLSNRRLRVLERSFNTVEKPFSWTPACRQTILEIDLAGNRLTKTYPGSYGFFAFLHDFKSGSHTFRRSDFPDHDRDLTDLDMESITVRYRFKGAPDFAAPKAAPTQIAWSWNR